MPMFPETWMDELLQKTDLVSLVSEYVPLTQKSGRLWGCCPFHNEKTPSFSVQPEKQMYYCFGCGAGGNVFTFLMQYENFSFPEAMEALAERAGIELPKQEMSAQAKKEADKRQKTVENFWKNGILDPDSNVQFGEGGAGTFSDGKLNTLVKDTFGRGREVLSRFVEAGAPSEILYQQKPHLGTDQLVGIVQFMRHQIEEMGGEFRFRSTVTDLMIRDRKLTAVIVNAKEEIPAEICILAPGHSARDTFAMLEKHNINMEPKSFAVGVRVEHPQTMINQDLYGEPENDRLGASSYKVTHTLENGRGVYSFCMCPGGYVVNASSEEGMLAVNGMSYQARDSHNANSAIIVTVNPSDFPEEGVLGGIALQRKLERAAWEAGKGKIPVQLFKDYCTHQKSTRLGDVIPCIKGAYTLTDVRSIFPKEIGDSIEAGIHAFGKKLSGFDRPDALLEGVESRTSSPVRIVREPKKLTSNIEGIYPCGEGAGYAGGITSAAMDGIKVAEAVASVYALPVNKM